MSYGSGEAVARTEREIGVTYPKGLHPGAVWKRADFQIHTPRDPQWTGSPHLAGGSQESEAARHAWADSFVQEALQRGLFAIAITDHHDLCFVDYVQEAIDRADVRDQLWLFPGMEVTCRDSTQCLILFDRDAAPEIPRRLFGGHLQNIGEPESTAQTNPQATECGRDVEDFFGSVAGDQILADASIILPNATHGGWKTMLRDGFAPRFATLPFDGVYIDKDISTQPDSARRKWYGEAGAWGNRRRGVLPTGDNRQQDFAKLGAHQCWIRLGEPTVEAIRQAMLADSARLAYERPATPAQRILQLRVRSTLTGPEFALTLNDGFNALIAGRGSGKSAILEYLRFGLGRSAGDVVSGEETYRERDRELIANTLVDGWVSVDLERDGVVETWTRKGAERDTINVNVEDGQELTLSINEAQLRFRARGFYQGQLSSILSDSNRTAEQVTGIAAAEFTDRRRVAEREIEAAKREVAAAYQRVVEYWVAESEHRSSVSTVADLRARIAAVSGRMTEAGLTEEQQRVLNDAPDYQLAESLIGEARRQTADDRAAIQEFGSRLASLRGNEWEQLFDRFPELEQMVAARDCLAGKIDHALEDVGRALEEFEANREGVFSGIEAAISDFVARHAEAKSLQESGRALFEEAQRLQAELQTALAGERAGANRMDRLATAPDGLAAARAQLRAKVDELRTLLGEAAASVDAMSGDLLRASVRRDQTPKEQVDALATLCEGARIRDLQSKCEERVRALAVQVENAGWDVVANAVLDVRKYRLQSGAAAVESSDRAGQAIQDNLLGDLTSGQLNAVFGRVDDGAVIRILTATPEDHIEFEYRDAGAYIPFVQASPGQQASALLQLLLNQEAGTLIIDQPEDDLDNRVIMEIAKLLQSTKRRRQLVFATHNPNFVVNGDADKIVALRPGSAEAQLGPGPAPRIAIDSDGAIETPVVRAAITDTMEGGRAAFELRSRKYDFEIA